MKVKCLPTNEIIMNRFHGFVITTKSIGERVRIALQLMAAANRMFWFGDVEIIIGPCENVAQIPKNVQTTNHLS